MVHTSSIINGTRTWCLHVRYCTKKAQYVNSWRYFYASLLFGGFMKKGKTPSQKTSKAPCFPRCCVVPKMKSWYTLFIPPPWCRSCRGAGSSHSVGAKDPALSAWRSPLGMRSSRTGSSTHLFGALVLSHVNRLNRSLDTHFCNTHYSTHAKRRGETGRPNPFPHALAAMSCQTPRRLRPLPSRPCEKRASIGPGIEDGLFLPARARIYVG